MKELQFLTSEAKQPIPSYNYISTSHITICHSFTKLRVKLSGRKEAIDFMDTNSRATSMSYRDFSPSFDWVEEEGFKVLQVNLPGFKKEQIRVQIDNNGKLRIRGEGHIKASGRFSELFELPESCEVADIQAMFENETLQVRFPVKQLDVPVYAAPKPAATLPQPESSQKRVNGQPTESVDAIKEESVKSQAKEDKSGKPAEKKEQRKAAEEVVHKANDEATGSVDATSKLQEKKLQAKEEVAAKVDDEVANRVKETQKTTSAMLAPGNGGGEFMARYGVGGLLTGLKREKTVLLVNLAVAILVSLALGLYLKYKNSTINCTYSGEGS